MTSGWPLVRSVGFLLAALPYGCGFAFVYSRGMLPNLCTVFLGGSLCWVSFCFIICVTHNQIYYYYYFPVMYCSVLLCFCYCIVCQRSLLGSLYSKVFSWLPFRIVVALHLCTAGGCYQIHAQCFWEVVCVG
jgi:hypothetical protein